MTTEYLHALDLSMDSPGATIFEITYDENNEISYTPVHIGHLKAGKKKSHGDRLYDIAKWLQHFIEEYPPSIVVLERGFSRFNTATQVIFRVHGVVNLLYRKYKQIYYTPKTVKEAILNGNATKKQLANRIIEVFPNIKFSEGDGGEDESDAFSVGICFLIKERHIPWEKIVAEKKKRATKSKKTAH